MMVFYDNPESRRLNTFQNVAMPVKAVMLSVMLRVFEQYAHGRISYSLFLPHEKCILRANEIAQLHYNHCGGRVG